jgi:hypothetical protein
MKVPVIVTDDYIIYLEEDCGFTFIHCDVLSKWNKKIKTNLKKSFDNLTQNYNKELFALHNPNDKKHKKFLRMFNFLYLQQIKGSDDSYYDVYIWR